MYGVDEGAGEFNLPSAANVNEVARASISLQEMGG